MLSNWLRHYLRKAIGLSMGFWVGCLLVLPPTPTYAHPLGNFSVNRYSRLDVHAEVLHVRYVLDMAEIPTVQEQYQIDTDGDGTISSTEAEHYGTIQLARIQHNLYLTINNTPVTLAPVTHALTFPSGQGNLPTLRLIATFEAALPADASQVQIVYEDNNYPERLGWQEIIAVAQPGAVLLAASVPTEDITNELRTYPADLLQSPLTVRQAHLTVARDAVVSVVGSVPLSTNGASGSTATAATEDSAGVSAAFAALVANTTSTPYAVGVALLIAFGLGAVHALSPGHGKTIVAAYLVGSRGTTGHALFLGLTTTVTHTIGVFALGLITLGVSKWFLPEQLYPILSLLSGSLVLLLGLALLHVRWHAFWHSHHAAPMHLHTHDDTEPHTHSHLFGIGSHSHTPPESGSALRWRNLLLLGISGGLLPCPSALIVLLSAIALGRVGFGLFLIFAFSLGLASVLTAIGVAMVHARQLVAALPGQGPTLRLLALAGSLVVVIFGAGMLLQSLTAIGLFKL
ncbi:MAG: high-affinity nickel-transporter [Chloroflexaceae bacterium]|nr:high-affinity nickel-transporter [Chloroflexaceae bacterium]